MINFFTIAQNDASIGFLTTIFGNMGGVIATPTGPTGGEISLLSTMFKAFNGVILTVGALMVVYITVTGVMITAHEGEFMGKKYHQIWTPLRTLLGIVALIPTYTGYSGIQIVMMWVIVQGIGAADVLWNTVLDYVQKWGSPYAQLTVVTGGTGTAVSAIFQGLVCDESARISSAPNLTDDGNYYCAVNRGCPTIIPVFDPRAKIYNFGPGGVCGTLTICDHDKLCAGTQSDSMACRVCEAQEVQLGVIVPVLRNIAHNLVQRDFEYRDFYANSKVTTRPEWGWIYNYCQSVGITDRAQCCVPGTMSLGGMAITAPSSVCKAKSTSPSLYSANKENDGNTPSPEAVAYIYYPFGNIVPSDISQNFMKTITDAYSDAINTAVKSKIDELMNKQPVTGNARLQESAKTGWVYAGSYYYIISQMNNSNKDSQSTGSQMSVARTQTDVMKNYRNNREAADTLADMAAGIRPSQNATFSGVNTAILNSSGDVSSALTALGSSTSNPISQMQMTGMILLAVVQTLFVGLVLVAGMVGLIGNFSFYILGTGMTNSIGPAYITVSMLIVPVVLALMGIMTTLGGLLGVYVPLIPYIVFTFGAIGWLISVLEAMVAGPLVALGILSPSGHHEIMGKAEPALMLIFSIFLRPALMIFGLMAGMLMATAVASMINTAFWTTVAAGIAGAGVSGGTADMKGGEGMMAANPLEGIIFIAAYVSIIVSAMNKCFSAIHVVPERVLAWIGGQAAQTGGESEALGEMKGGVSGASGGAKSAIGGTHAQGKAAKKARAKFEGAESGPKISAPGQTKGGNLPKKKEGGDDKGGDKGGEE